MAGSSNNDAAKEITQKDVEFMMKATAAVTFSSMHKQKIQQFKVTETQLKNAQKEFDTFTRTYGTGCNDTANRPLYLKLRFQIVTLELTLDLLREQLAKFAQVEESIKASYADVEATGDALSWLNLL